MKVIIRIPSHSKYVPVNIPTWNVELFQSDPEGYLEPLMEEYPADAYWEAVYD